MHSTLEIGVCVFVYVIEQLSEFWLHTLQVLYMCTLCDSTNINTIIEFVPKLFVARQRWWFQWRFWFVPSVPGYTRTPVSRNCAYHLRMELSGGGCFTNLLHNCSWTIVPRQSFWITLYYIIEFCYHTKGWPLSKKKYLPVVCVGAKTLYRIVREVRMSSFF